MKLDNKIINKLIVAAIALVVGFLFGSMWKELQILKGGSTAKQGTTTTAQAPTEEANNLADMPEVTSDDHIIGSLDAPIILVEYSDYECPYCSLFHPTMKQVLEQYGDQVAWVYRHYPAPSLGHTQAQISAEAAECVAKVGGNEAFWAFSDMMFENTLPLVEARQSAGTALTREKLLGYATQIGVSSSDIANCLDNEETTALVTEDKSGGISAGVNGTPGTILVTQDGDFDLIGGALPFEQVTAIIDQYL